MYRVVVDDAVLLSFAKYGDWLRRPKPRERPRMTSADRRVDGAACHRILRSSVSSREEDFPFTHDLRRLLDLSTKLLPVLKEFGEPLLRFASYAVDVRYEEETSLTEAEARENLEVVRRLRSVIHSVLPPEARP